MLGLFVRLVFLDEAVFLGEEKLEIECRAPRMIPGAYSPPTNHAIGSVDVPL